MNHMPADDLQQIIEHFFGFKNENVVWCEFKVLL